MYASSRTIQATATANLLRLGFEAAACRTILRDWCAVQEQYGIGSVAAKGLPYRRYRFDALPDQLDGTFVVSAHFGSMPHLLAALSQRSRSRHVTALFGTIPEIMRNALRQVATNAGFQLDLVAGGFGMMRKLKAAVKAGHVLFAATDVPWALQKQQPVYFPFMAGRVIGLPGVFDLIKRLGLAPIYALAYPDDNEVVIRGFGALSQAESLTVLADAMVVHPELYERLYHIHHFYESREELNDAVLFDVTAVPYVIHTKDMKAWQLTLAATPDSNAALAEISCAAIANSIGRPVSHVVCI